MPNGRLLDACLGWKGKERQQEHVSLHLYLLFPSPLFFLPFPSAMLSSSRVSDFSLLDLTDATDLLSITFAAGLRSHMKELNYNKSSPG